MAFRSLIQAELGLGTSQFTAGLRQGEAQATRSAGEIEKAFRSKFSGAALTRGLLSSLALDAKSIADTIASAISDGSLEGWKNAERRADEYGEYLEQRLRRSLSPADLAERLNRQANQAETEADAPRRQLTLSSNSLLGGNLVDWGRALANRLGFFGAESGADYQTRQTDGRLRAARLRDEAAAVSAKAEDEAIAKLEQYLATLKAIAAERIRGLNAAADTEGRIALATDRVREAQQQMAATRTGTVEQARAELELLNRQNELAELHRAREKELTAEKTKQLAAEQAIIQARTRALAELARLQQRAASAQAAYATALSDQSAATFDEVLAGRRGSPDDQRRATEIARLRAAARSERDAGNTQLVGGQLVAVADTLSTRANQLQTGIAPLNSTERDPLGALAEQLTQANRELTQIRQSLEIVATD